MKETLLLLVAAHLLADFVFQFDWIIQNKKKPWVLAVHIVIVALLSMLLLGQWNHQAVWAAVASHLLIDFIKVQWLPDKLWSFLADQFAHLAMMSISASYFWDGALTGYWHGALWETWPLYLKAMILLCGLILAIPVGGILIAKTVKPLLSEQEYEMSQGVVVLKQENLEQMKGLPGGGKIIGWLERSLVLLLLWIQQPAGIGFLVTAKSILRFGDVKDSQNRRITEYLIIGTLMSFGWAVFVGTLMQETFHHFPK